MKQLRTPLFPNPQRSSVTRRTCANTVCTPLSRKQRDAMAGEYTADRMDIARENLKRLRRLHNPPITQGRMAEKLGYNRSTYVNYENGRRRPSAEFLLDAAKYFGISVENLCDRELKIMKKRRE